VSVTAEQSKNSMEGNNINNNNNSGEGYMTYTENGDRAHKQPKTTNNDETTKRWSWSLVAWLFNRRVNSY